ncbi:helix-turn-helix transcriptional regulator [Streptomyces sp. NPDC047841]|uniref:helix-turn-helix transcriptional regulator n=1 Tax=Streptomyces sp. NPDC047841 TaxID=3154708 RepID=UPI003455C83A
METLCDTDLIVYAHCLDHPGQTSQDLAASAALDEAEVRRSVARLLDAHLLVTADAARGPSAPLHAVSPEAAAARVAAPVEETIRRQRQQLSQARAELSRFLPVYLDRDRSLNAVRVVDNVVEVRHLLNKASRWCRAEVRSAQPGGGARKPEAMDEALDRDRAMLRRGIRLRTLYHHTARFNGPSQSYVSAASQLGAEYRTVYDLFGRLIVFDQELAFLQAQDDEFGAVVVREKSMIAYLTEIFDRTWHTAQPFSDAPSAGLEGTARELHRPILRLLAAGLKDEALARRLGMSLRTTRRHIATIMQDLGATSRFQAGVIAAQRGLLGR